MKNETTQKASNGVGCLTILGLILITLKLAEIGVVAQWSWWWVLAPFWVAPVLIIVLLIVGGVGVGLVFLFAAIVKRFRRGRRPLKRY